MSSFNIDLIINTTTCRRFCSLPQGHSTCYIHYIPDTAELSMRMKNEECWRAIWTGSVADRIRLSSLRVIPQSTCQSHWHSERHLHDRAIALPTPKANDPLSILHPSRRCICCSGGPPHAYIALRDATASGMPRQQEVLCGTAMFEEVRAPVRVSVTDVIL
jgi:hypothetical protein